MPEFDFIYYAAGGFSVLMARAPSLLQMQIFHLIAASLFVVYGAMAEVWPIVVMNGLLGAIQAVRLLGRTFRTARPAARQAPAA